MRIRAGEPIEKIKYNTVPTDVTNDCTQVSGKDQRNHLPTAPLNTQASIAKICPAKTNTNGLDLALCKSEAAQP